MFDSQFSESSDEILVELKVELAQRFLGKDGGTTERLKFDKQFNTALQIFNNDAAYSKFLTRQ